MAEKTLEVVLARQEFYQESYRNLALATVLLLVLVVSLVGLNLNFLSHRERPPEFFAMTCDGSFATVTPLSSPYVTDSQLLAWANEVLMSVYSFDFVHYREQLESASHQFTIAGWNSFGNIFKKARNLETVLGKKLLVSAEPTAAPMITKRGVVGGRYTWQVSMPILVTYQNSDTNIQQALNVIINVKRVPMLHNPNGIAVAQYIASEGK